MQLLNCPNAISMVEDILHMEKEKCLKVCILLWLWWSERNRATQGERIRTEEEIIYSVQLHLLEYKKYIKRREQNVQAVNQVWCPPPDDFLKINTDGAFRLSTKSGGWGFTIKNNHGIALVAGGAGSLENVAEPLQAEALAMLYAVNEASRMGCQKVILETDAVALKQAITSDLYDYSSLGVLFKEIRAVLQSAFQSCKVETCPRACNISAHCLAAHGVCMERKSYQIWLDPFPSHVTKLVAGESSLPW